MTIHHVSYQYDEAKELFSIELTNDTFKTGSNEWVIDIDYDKLRTYQEIWIGKHLTTCIEFGMYTVTFHTSDKKTKASKIGIEYSGKMYSKLIERKTL